MERLSALMLKAEAGSYAEVVKNALRLYEALIEETEGGKRIPYPLGRRGVAVRVAPVKPARHGRGYWQMRKENAADVLRSGPTEFL